MFAKSMPSYLTYFPDMLFIEKCLKDFIPVFWNVSLFRPYRANTKLLSIRTMSISLIYELRHPYHINKMLMNFCTQIILFPISSWWDLNCGYMIWKLPICQLCHKHCSFKIISTRNVIYFYWQVISKEDLQQKVDDKLLSGANFWCCCYANSLRTISGLVCT